MTVDDLPVPASAAARAVAEVAATPSPALLGPGEEFIRCFEGQAQRRPDSRAGAFVAGGFADRVRGNVLDNVLDNG
ncbi:hypothetical protein SAMN05661080_03026 [Modestobacter sp. DSM 44400]|uniref:hypothetical protein n=1 Tax=Modestobacter sp. DSM 44400 TaxID=1550230 RepID=UPI0008955CE1|nr:hypothetical protein [Modestobacter sp. DSM 44400]SDY30634.1 hypothetical protein SAMN05661080_03026 [Modestobacter sp. DSM 44400]